MKRKISVKREPRIDISIENSINLYDKCHVEKQLKNYGSWKRQTKNSL